MLTRHAECFVRRAATAALYRSRAQREELLYIDIRREKGSYTKTRATPRCFLTCIARVTTTIRTSREGALIDSLLGGVHVTSLSLAHAGTASFTTRGIRRSRRQGWVH